MPRQLYQDNKLPVAPPPPPESEEEEEPSESAPVFVKCKRSEKCSKENGHVGGCNSKLAKKPKNAAKAPKAPKKAAPAPSAAPLAKRSKKTPAPTPAAAAFINPEIQNALRILSAVSKALEEEAIPEGCSKEYLAEEVEKKFQSKFGTRGLPFGDKEAMKEIPALNEKFEKEAIAEFRAGNPSSLRTKYIAALNSVNELETAL